MPKKMSEEPPAKVEDHLKSQILETKKKKGNKITKWTSNIPALERNIPQYYALLDKHCQSFTCTKSFRKSFKKTKREDEVSKHVSKTLKKFRRQFNVVEPEYTSKDPEKQLELELEVIDEISQREKLVKKLSKEANLIKKDHSICHDPVVSVKLLVEIKQVSLRLVEKVEKWRDCFKLVEKGETHLYPAPFIWEGTNYLLKMISDLDFIATVKPIVKALRVSAETLIQNPFMSKSKLIESETYQNSDSRIEKLEKVLRDELNAHSYTHTQSKKSRESTSDSKSQYVEDKLERLNLNLSSWQNEAQKQVEALASKWGVPIKEDVANSNISNHPSSIQTGSKYSYKACKSDVNEIMNRMDCLKLQPSIRAKASGRKKIKKSVSTPAFLYRSFTSSSRQSRGNPSGYRTTRKRPRTRPGLKPIKNVLEIHSSNKVGPYAVSAASLYKLSQEDYPEPLLVLSIAIVVVVLTSNKSNNLPKDLSWPVLQVILRDNQARTLINSMEDFDPTSISDFKLSILTSVIDNERLNPLKLRPVSPIAAAFLAWIHKIHKEYKMGAHETEENSSYANDFEEKSAFEEEKSIISKNEGEEQKVSSQKKDRCSKTETNAHKMKMQAMNTDMKAKNTKKIRQGVNILRHLFSTNTKNNDFQVLLTFFEAEHSLSERIEKVVLIKAYNPMSSEEARLILNEKQIRSMLCLQTADADGIGLTENLCKTLFPYVRVHGDPVKLEVKKLCPLF